MNRNKTHFIELPVSYNTNLTEKVKDKLILLKYSGNAMVDAEIKRGVISDVDGLFIQQR